MDWQSIQPLFFWLSDHPVWSGLFVFLIALTESLVIVGLIVPGTVLMFGVGTLVGTGVLDIKLVLFLAFAGAVLGDGISFWFGATYREQISTFWPFKNNPQILDKGKLFFNRHGGKSIFFGRFVGPVRPVIPAIAGMMHMPVKKFFLINVISAAGWAPFYLIPGILFGSSIGLASAIGSRLVIILLSLFTIAIILVFTLKKLMQFVTPKLETWLSHLLLWSSKHTLIGPIVSALIDPDKKMTSTLISAILIIFFLSLFFLIFISSFLFPWVTEIDTVIKNIFSLIRSDHGDELMGMIQVSFSWLIIILSLVNIAINLYCNSFRKALGVYALLLIVVLFSSWFSILLYSYFLIDVINGTIYLQLSILTSMLVFYVVISSEKHTKSSRWLYYSTAVLLILLFSYSCLYFSYLSFSQVFSAISLAAVWVLVFALAYRRHRHKMVSANFISGSTILICLLTIGLTNDNNGQKIERLNISYSEPVIISTDDWLDNGWAQLPKYRSDVFDKKRNTLDFQWQGSLNDIKRTLADEGWQASKDVTFKSLMYWLAPEPDLNQIIRLPQTNDGNVETILYVKPGKNINTQLTLQLWPTSMISEVGDPIWVGLISNQRLISDERWLSFFRAEKQSTQSLVNEGGFNQWQKVTRERLVSEPEADVKTVLLMFK